MYRTSNRNNGSVDRSPRDFSEPTSDLFVPLVVRSSTCVKHRADYNQYCFTHNALNDLRIIGGICNHRALKMGFNGLIKDSSLRARPKVA